MIHFYYLDANKISSAQLDDYFQICTIKNNNRKNNVFKKLRADLMKTVFYYSFGFVIITVLCVVSISILFVRVNKKK